jgi:hypothetical protein
MSDASFLPPQFDHSQVKSYTHKSAEESFEETVVKNVVRTAREPEEVLRLVKAQHRGRTGKPGLAIEDLRTVTGFPVDIRISRDRVSPVSHFLTAVSFRKTPLFARWCELLDNAVSWGPSGRRALAFHWIGWGICVLTDSELAETAECKLVIDLPDFPPLYVLHLTEFVLNSDWSYLKSA